MKACFSDSVFYLKSHRVFGTADPKRREHASVVSYFVSERFLHGPLTSRSRIQPVLGNEWPGPLDASALRGLRPCPEQHKLRQRRPLPAGICGARCRSLVALLPLVPFLTGTCARVQNRKGKFQFPSTDAAFGEKKARRLSGQRGPRERSRPPLATLAPAAAPCPGTPHPPSPRREGSLARAGRAGPLRRLPPPPPARQARVGLTAEQEAAAEGAPEGGGHGGCRRGPPLSSGGAGAAAPWHRTLLPSQAGERGRPETLPPYPDRAGRGGAGRRAGTGLTASERRGTSPVPRSAQPSFS